MNEEHLEKELIEFLKHVKEVHTDSYGNLEVCDTGDELDPTVERVVKQYLKSKENNITNIEEFYVIQNGWVGDFMIFWREGRAGYTSNFEKTHKFTLEEAKRTCRDFERIFSWNELEKLTTKGINSEIQQTVWDHEVV
jgi:hypothetical protein